MGIGDRMSPDSRAVVRERTTTDDKRTDPNSDELTVQLALARKDGDTGPGTTALFNGVYREVREMARKRGFDEQTAADCALDTAEAAIRTSSSIEDLVPWMHWKVRNYQADQWRERQVRERAVQSLARQLDTTGDFTEDADGEMFLDAVFAELRRRSLICAEVLERRIMRGMRFREIGDELGKTEGGCRQTYVRGLRLVREIIQKHFT